MNLSGKSVTAALRYWKIAPEEALLAHDELDLPPGTARIKFDGGHGGQNGLRDTMQLLGHGKFHRLRIGIGHPGHKDKVTGWVLGKPGKDDEILIGRAIDEAIEVLPLAVAGNFMDAMTRLHTTQRVKSAACAACKESRVKSVVREACALSLPFTLNHWRSNPWASNAASSACRTSASRLFSMR